MHVLTGGRSLDKMRPAAGQPTAPPAGPPPVPRALDGTRPPPSPPPPSYGGGFNVGQQVVIRENDETERAWIVKVRAATATDGGRRRRPMHAHARAHPADPCIACMRAGARPRPVRGGHACIHMWILMCMACALRVCAQVLGHGRFAVDYRDGVTSYEEIDGRQLRLPDASEVAA